MSGLALGGDYYAVPLSPRCPPSKCDVYAIGGNAIDVRAGGENHARRIQTSAFFRTAFSAYFAGDAVIAARVWSFSARASRSAISNANKPGTNHGYGVTAVIFLVCCRRVPSVRCLVSLWHRC